MENNDVVRLLVLGQKPIGAGGDCEMARRFSERGLVLEHSQFFLTGIETENGDAVLPTIGGINKFAVRMNFHFGAALKTREIVGQQRDRLQFLQSAVKRIIRE